MIHVPLILRRGPAQDGCPECYILSDVNKNKTHYNIVNSLIQIWYGEYSQMTICSQWHNAILLSGTKLESRQHLVA